MHGLDLGGYPTPYFLWEYHRMTHYKLYMHIYHNYSIEGMKKKKKKKLEEYNRIKVDIKCVLFLLNPKTKYTFQTPTVNHIIYKTHKFTKSKLNIKIVITVVTQYKMQAPLTWL